MTALGRYPADIRAKAVQAVEQRRMRNPRDRTIFREVAQQLGVGEQSLRLWVKHYDNKRLSEPAQVAEPVPATDAAPEADPDTLAQRRAEDEIRVLRQQVQKLRAENDILKRAFVMFSSEWEKAEPGEN